jgi:hypothetical protein
MVQARWKSVSYGAWLFLLSSGAALCLSVIDYLFAAGINHTGGVVLVIVSTAALLLAALLAIAFALAPWLRGLLNVGIFLGLLGTGFAAYLLEAPWLLVLMVVALAAWVSQLVRGTHREVRFVGHHAQPGAMS